VSANASSCPQKPTSGNVRHWSARADATSEVALGPDNLGVVLREACTVRGWPQQQRTDASGVHRSPLPDVDQGCTSQQVSRLLRLLRARTRDVTASIRGTNCPRNRTSTLDLHLPGVRSATIDRDRRGRFGSQPSRPRSGLVLRHHTSPTQVWGMPSRFGAVEAASRPAALTTVRHSRPKARSATSAAGEAQWLQVPGPCSRSQAAGRTDSRPRTARCGARRRPVWLPTTPLSVGPARPTGSSRGGRCCRTRRCRASAGAEQGQVHAARRRCPSGHLRSRGVTASVCAPFWFSTTLTAGPSVWRSSRPA